MKIIDLIEERIIHAYPLKALNSSLSKMRSEIVMKEYK